MDRWPSVVSALGGLFVVLAVGQLLLDAVSGPPAELPVTLVVLTLLPGFVLLYGGSWLARSAIHPDVYSRVVGWCLGGLGALLGVFVLLVLEPSISIDQPFRSGSIAVAIGSVGGLMIGLREAQMITQANEARRQNRELRRYETLIEKTTDVNAIVAPDGSFRYLTPSVERVLGYESDELTGENAFEYVHPEDRETVGELFADAVETGETSPVTEFKFRHGDGSWVTLEGRVRNLLDDPAIDGLVAYTHDITRRKQRERQLHRQNQRLGSFASMLAHELRNPLTIGQIYSRHLSADEHPEAVGHVRDAFDRIEDMIDVMLVLAGGDEMIDDPEPVSLPEAARNAWSEIDAPDATLDVEADYVLQADETYVRHLCRNLFENAVEHGGSGVTITVGDLPTGFYVEDDGPGISASERAAVFEAGYTTAASEGGMGLGLTFVQELADTYGWSCAVRESEAGGARFEFSDVASARADVDRRTR